MKDLYVINARLVNTDGTAAKGKIAYMSVPGRQFEFRTAVSDSSGRLKFLVKNLHLAKQVIFQTNSITDGKIKFEFDDTLARRFDATKYAKRIKEIGDTLPFYGKADKDYLLDDYTRFPTMDEVFREFIAEVRVRKSRDRYRMEVINLPYRIFFTGEPLILLDGVPVFDTNIIMALDPLKIRNIQVVSRTYYFGELLLKGIVSITTYDNDLAGYQLPPEAQVRDITPGLFKK
jgi:hypothetical protein